MSADLLRRAAAAVRDAASVACPDDWYVTVLPGRVLAGDADDPVEVLEDLSASYDNSTLAALMHPPVALALADVLESAAAAPELIGRESNLVVELPQLARAILREES